MTSRVPVLLLRSALVLVLSLSIAGSSSACAITTTTHHDEPPLPTRPSFRARVVLRTPTLRTHARAHVEAWSARLRALGVRSEWVFDEDRAIVDLDDVSPERLERVIRALTDPGGYHLSGHNPGVATATQVRLPTAGCRCQSLVRVVGDGHLLNIIQQGSAYYLERGGLLLSTTDGPITLRPHHVEWRSDSQVAVPSSIDFAVDVRGEALEDVLLALNGSVMPSAIQVVSVQRAGAR